MILGDQSLGVLALRGLEDAGLSLAQSVDLGPLPTRLLGRVLAPLGRDRGRLGQLLTHPGPVRTLPSGRPT